VLGARIGLAGLQSLDKPVRQEKKELLVISETDGCFLSGLEAATNVSVNHRTMRVVDFGKLAATIVHVASDQAFRISLKPNIRKLAWVYARENENRHYFAMLTGYQKMPLAELIAVKKVKLSIPAFQLISRPGIRTNCTKCGEEIINEREILKDGDPYCLDCAGNNQ
jgi:formylmethanofuran dehydrogenase subunit E